MEAKGAWVSRVLSPVMVACLGWVLLLVMVLSQLMLWHWHDSLG